MEGKIILKKDHCLALKDFLSNTKVNCLEQDDILKGLKGFNFWIDGKNGEIEFSVAYKDSCPIKKVFDVEENFEESFKECVTKNNGWISHDDPLSRRIGFVNLEKSECRYFPLFVFKELTQTNPDLVKKFSTPRQRSEVRI